jgi:DNA-binding transcriptional ArsR family regulator
LPVDVFAALADPVRRSLLEEVAAGQVRVVDLAASRPISRPAVSKHLKVLVDAGLVRVTVRGRERHYALEATGLAPVSALLERLVLAGTSVSAHALDALATEVRRTSRDRRRSAPRQETA